MRIIYTQLLCLFANAYYLCAVFKNEQAVKDTKKSRD